MPWFRLKTLCFPSIAALGIAFCVLLCKSDSPAQTLVPGEKVDPQSLEWPRFYATNSYEFAVYQPCISKWPGNQIEGQFVVAVRPQGTSNESYGVIFFKARTEIDKVNRLVTFEDFKVTKANFPTKKGMQKKYVGMLESFQKQAVHVIPLDHLESVFAASGDVEKAKIQEVKNDPPRLIYTTQPSVLILVDGAPILKPLVGDYERIINTRPVVLWNKGGASPGYYLYAAEHWYTAPSLDGPWTVSVPPPADIQAALDAAIATKEVDLMPPEDPAAMPSVLHIYVSTVPAELIETQGAPNLLAISGTDLLHVGNTSSAIFFYLDDGNYYVLISGRWFKSVSLSGPWAFVPAGKLPADFQKIPPDHEKSNVLASVPGTPQAQEAVIASSIPQTATIKRTEARLTVVYEGAPSFVGIPATPLTYAVNTATPVVQVNAKSYYACEGGTWFVAGSALGPWAVATSVPGVIYTIPLSCPIHYVTYAYVYGYTDSVVYVGYTPGYAGTVLAPGGVVVYGTGYYYPPVVIGTTYVAYPPTYGYGASFALGMSVGFAFGYCAGSMCCCQPYWGCYHWATPYGYGYSHCNVNSTSFYTHWGTAVHTTGSYGYNAYTGNKWAGQHASAYNPYTGASAAGSRGAVGNVYSGNYAAGRQGAGYNPSTGMYGAGQKGVVGNAYNGTASTVNRGVAGNTKTGNSVAWNNGNMYADKGGNTYKYNQSSGAQKYNSGSDSWQSVNKPSSSSFSSAQSSWQGRASSSQSSWGNKSSGGWGGSSGWADRAGSSQSAGSDRFSGWNRGGGGGWGGFGGGRFGGGGFRR
jgi:hypothetical protein